MNHAEKGERDPEHAGPKSARPATTGVRGATNPDNRPGSVRQGRLIEAIAQSPRVRGRAGGVARPVDPVQRWIAKGGVPLGIPLEPVQRNAESAALLTELATPIVRPGPEVEIQQAIVAALEAKFEGEEASSYAVSCLGAIELPENLDVDDEALIEACELVNLPDNAVKQSTFELIDGPLAEMIVRNTIRTMLAARQVEYLRKSGLGRNAKILVEIHYYRDRSPSQTKFHKDTRGQTLFVNLNFTNENEIAGPEFVVNPARVPKHEELVAKTLPDEFRQDLAIMRENLAQASFLGGPDPSGIIGASRVSPHGMVAFVDEAIHHKTPTYGHRSVMPGSLRFYLKTELPSEYKAAEKAFERYNRRLLKRRSFSSYYKGASPEQAAMWEKLLELAGRREGRVRRPELLEAGLRQEQVDDLMQRYGSTDFTEVSLPLTGQTNIPVREKGHPPLKRQMSELALAGSLPPPVEGKRRFFRTWVRALPR